MSQFKMKECPWIGLNTSLLVWSGFDVPFGRHLTRRLYVAEFNFRRVPHPCRFGMEAFQRKVWASETKSNINIHYIFRSTAINQNQNRSQKQHVFKSLPTTSYKRRGLSGRKEWQYHVSLMKQKKNRQKEKGKKERKIWVKNNDSNIFALWSKNDKRQKEKRKKGTKKKEKRKRMTVTYPPYKPKMTNDKKKKSGWKEWQ